MDDGKSDVTALLKRWSGGEREAQEPLLDLVYDELRRLAKRYLQRERRDHLLETKALVHEAYLRLVDQTRVEWTSRAHFYAVASQTMRRILIDHARRRGHQKRGGDAERVDLDEALRVVDEVPADLVALDDALRALAETDPEKSRLVEMRFFGGLSHAEIAEVLGVSISTVDRGWRLAKAWLYQALRNDEESTRG